jgi:hypothetical protein
LENFGLKGTVISESNEMDIGFIRGMCGLDSGIGFFGPDGGTGSGRGGARDLLDYHDDVPVGSRRTCSRNTCVVSSQTTQAADSYLHARIGLDDSIVAGVGRGRCDFV